MSPALTVESPCDETALFMSDRTGPWTDRHSGLHRQTLREFLLYCCAQLLVVNELED